MTGQALGPGPSLKSPVGDAPVVPLFLLGTGMYLAWFGVHYWRSDVKWPTDPVKAVLQGKPLPGAAGTPTANQEAVLKAAQAQLAGVQGVTPSAGQPGAGSAAVGQAVAAGAAPNQSTGKLLAASYGWSSGSEWDALVQLWDEESGWDNRVWNGGSTAPTHDNPAGTAFGIPQALPYTKMPRAAWPSGYGGQADPTSQISWGLAYIKQRYGSPSAAWSFHLANGYY